MQLANASENVPVTLSTTATRASWVNVAHALCRSAARLVELERSSTYVVRTRRPPRPPLAFQSATRPSKVFLTEKVDPSSTPAEPCASLLMYRMPTLTGDRSAAGAVPPGAALGTTAGAV